VRYRMLRLRELFGPALDDPDGRFELELAMRAGVYAGSDADASLLRAARRPCAAARAAIDVRAPLRRPRRRGKEQAMGRAVVHFEVVGKDPDAAQAFYASMFGWKIDADNPMKYGLVQREDNLNKDGIGIGGGIGAGPEGYGGHVTFYVEVPDVEAALAQAEQLGGSRMMGPEDVAEGVQIGLFGDPEGHIVGVIKGAA
jgi:uncharacterized protein